VADKAAGAKGPNKVALDTSILLSIPENKARVFEGIREKIFDAEFFVTGSVLRELDILQERKGKRQGVEIVRKALKANNVKTLENDCENADDCLAEKASSGFIVATSDSALKKRIKGFGGRIIYLKKGKLIEIE
jgi:rRNA-processing protein FCF1